MFDTNDPGVPTPGAHRHRSRPTRLRTPVIGVSLATIAGLVVASQTVLASPGSAVVKTSTGPHRAAAPALSPPAGTTWIEGVITDQANNGQDNVNVEAWARGGGATTPAASSLTYGGPPNKPSILHGFFLLQVPSDQAYRITFSSVGGKEDGDPFRMRSYGHGRPIVVRNVARAAGRTRDLGSIALARQGHVASKTKVTLGKAKVTAGKRATVHVKVTSRFVSNVTGKFTVRVAGKKITHRLTTASHSKSTVKLPVLKNPGKYKITASYAGSGTVHRSKAKPVKLTVRK